MGGVWVLGYPSPAGGGIPLPLESGLLIGTGLVVYAGVLSARYRQVRRDHPGFRDWPTAMALLRIIATGAMALLWLGVGVSGLFT